MKDLFTRKNPYHPDIIIFLLLIPFISAFNYYLTYRNISFNGFLLLTYTLDTVQGYAGWYMVRILILYMDKRLPYSSGTTKRIVTQIIVTSIAGLVVITLLTELVSWIARGHSADKSFYTTDIFIIGIWFFVVNGIYIVLHFYNEWQKSEAKLKEENRIKEGGLVLRLGKKDIRINFEDLAGIYVDQDYVTAVDKDEKKYILDQSLDKIEKDLPHTYFFRLNRQFIIHRNMVKGFQRAENGKIKVLLNETSIFPQEIPVSRTKAPSFKNWFQPE